jgi:FkbM family methyltransferase
MHATALRLLSAIRSRLGLPPLLIRQSILGREMVVPYGCYREKPDYDDAWRLACAMHSEIIFDIGANVGQAALTELLSDQPKMIVLVDANPEALAVAAQTLIRNNLSARARFVTAFVGSESGKTTTFWTVGTGSAGSMYRGHAKTASKAGTSIEAPTITIDDLCHLYQTIPDFIKIDVEGAEHLVLCGSNACVQHRKTRFLVEMHSPPELPMSENAARVLQWCADHRFTAWYLKEGTQLPSPALIAHRGRCHLLLQPLEWTYPEWLRNLRQSDPLEHVWTENAVSGLPFSRAEDV